MARHNSWSIERKIEALAEMDRTLMKMHVASYETIWADWGGGMKTTPEETEANWRKIAEDDKLFNDVLFCFMIGVIEPLTMEKFGMKNLKAIRKAIEK